MPGKAHSEASTLPLDTPITDAEFQNPALFVGRLTSREGVYLDFSQVKDLIEEQEEPLKGNKVTAFLGKLKGTPKASKLEAFLNGLLVHGVTDIVGCNFTGRSAVTDKDVAFIAKEYPNLQTITLSSCPHITDRSVKVLAEQCQSLAALELDFCEKITDSAISTLVDKAYALQNLSLQHCPQVTEKHIVDLAKKCQSLRSLDLSYNSHIKDKTVKSLLHKAPNLRFLGLKACRFITEKAFVSEDEKKEYALQGLVLDECGGVTDEALQAILPHFPHLLVLSLQGYRRASDDSVALLDEVAKATAEKMQKEHKKKPATPATPATPAPAEPDALKEAIEERLQQIHAEENGKKNPHFTYVVSLTDVAANAIAEHCKQLTSLNLNGSRLSDSGVNALVTSCGKLQYLHLKGCPISRKALVDLGNNYPHVKVAGHSVKKAQAQNAFFEEQQRLEELSKKFAEEQKEQQRKTKEAKEEIRTCFATALSSLQAGSEIDPSDKALNDAQNLLIRYQDFAKHESGEVPFWGGIGAYNTEERETLFYERKGIRYSAVKPVAVVPGSAAEKAGLYQKYIVGVIGADGIPVYFTSKEEGETRMKGRNGTRVTVIYQESLDPHAEEKQVTVTRGFHRNSEEVAEGKCGNVEDFGRYKQVKEFLHSCVSMVPEALHEEITRKIEKGPLPAKEAIDTLSAKDSLPQTPAEKLEKPTVIQQPTPTPARSSGSIMYV